MSRESIKGFAAGLFFATGILGGYYFFDKEDKQTVTIETLKEVSDELGYTLVKADDYSKETINEKNENKSESPNTNTTPESASEALFYTFSITSGMGSDDIAQLLFENKMIEDADSFEQYLIDHKMTKKIRVGEFQITNKMSFEEITNIITKKAQ